MDKNLVEILANPVVTGIFAILVAFGSSRFYSHQAKAELKKEYESRFNTKKWEVYTEFANLINDMFGAIKDKSLDKKMGGVSKRLLAFSGNLWIVGSDAVIKSFVQWQASNREAVNAEGEAPNTETLYKLAEIVIQMRKDLGYESDQVTAHELLAIIFPDLPDPKAS